MNPVQTSVLDYPPVAIAGMWGGGPSRIRDVMSRIAEAGVNAGLVVVGGTDPLTQCKPPSALADLNEAGQAAVNICGGVVLHEHRGADGDTYLYPAQTAVNIVRKGRVWMVTETALAAGVHPFVRCVATGDEQAGALRNDADTTDAISVQWLWTVGSTSGAGLIEVEVRLPFEFDTDTDT